MRGRVFLFLLTTVIAISGMSQPALLRPLLATPPNPTATATLLPPTATSSPTPNYFAHVPTATPYGRGGAVVQPLPSPSLGDPPPTFTPVPALSPPDAAATQNTAITPEPALLLPDPSQQTGRPAPATDVPLSVRPPERLQIPQLNLEAPIEPAAMMPSTAAPGVYEWAVPDHRAAGWLAQSASFAEPGNIVLAGHHNMAGEVFRDIWTLRAGDEITLWAGSEARVYQVTKTLILPERDQPLDVRLANARYSQPTPDEQLTLITCWPYEDNSHRAVVIARPMATEGRSW